MESGLDLQEATAAVHKPTLLVVDDEENIVRTLARTLRPYFELLTATSGKAALALLGERKVDLILTDQRMPGMTGVELLAKAKQLQPGAVGVMITAYTDVEALADALMRGIQAYFARNPPLARNRQV